MDLLMFWVRRSLRLLTSTPDARTASNWLQRWSCNPSLPRDLLHLRAAFRSVVSFPCVHLSFSWRNSYSCYLPSAFHHTEVSDRARFICDLADHVGSITRSGLSSARWHLIYIGECRSALLRCSFCACDVFAHCRLTFVRCICAPVGLDL